MVHLVPTLAAAVIAARIDPSRPRAPLARVRVESISRVGARIVRTPAQIPLSHDLLPAFAAFGRGTVFATPKGAGLSIEDIEPGDKLRTLDGGETTVAWIGSVELTPACFQKLSANGAPILVRVTPDRFGYARPARDVVLAASMVVEDGETMVRAGDLVDYESILPLTPPGPVRMYQLACEHQSTLIADGMAVPGFALDMWLAQQDGLVQTIMSGLVSGSGPEFGNNVA